MLKLIGKKIFMILRSRFRLSKHMLPIPIGTVQINKMKRNFEHKVVKIFVFISYSVCLKNHLSEMVLVN